MKKLIIKYPLAVYFILANLISWIIWLPLVLDKTVNDGSNGPLWYLHYLGGLGPMIAAIILTYKLKGRDGIKNIINRSLIIGGNLKWVIIGFSLPFIVFLFVVVMIGLYTGNWIDVSLLAKTTKLPQLGIVGIMFIEIIAYGFGEEIGWRGFALPRLQQRFSILTSSVILTLFWALWHLPAFFYNFNMMNLGVAGTIGWIMSLYTGSIILAWLVNRSKGNILPAILFHGMIDVVFISKAVAGKYDTALGVAITIFAILLIIFELRNKKLFIYKED